MVWGEHNTGQGSMLGHQFMVRGGNHTDYLQGLVHKHVVQVSLECPNIVCVLGITTGTGQIKTVSEIKAGHFLSSV